MQWNFQLVQCIGGSKGRKGHTSHSAKFFYYFHASGWLAPPLANPGSAIGVIFALFAVRIHYNVDFNRNPTAPISMNKAASSFNSTRHKINVIHDSTNRWEYATSMTIQVFLISCYLFPISSISQSCFFLFWF